MAYRNILVHVPLRDFDEQVDFAVAVAKHFGAHLTGVCSLKETAMLKSAIQNPFIKLGQSAEVEDTIEAERLAASGAERRFRTAAEAGEIAHSWVATEDDVGDLIGYACRLQDLAIIEQRAEGSELVWRPAVQAALAGFPVLTIPRAWRGAAMASRVIVAWNGSAESAAALRHAVPLLTGAEHVRLIVRPPRERRPAPNAPPLDAKAYLQHHGIDAVQSQIDVVGDEAGSAILDMAETLDAKLIVMGAYSRPRFREWVLGGATRQILEKTRIPVFMVH
jgi:nucleotide-binding universal stress UspA family protein